MFFRTCLVGFFLSVFISGKSVANPKKRLRPGHLFFPFFVIF